MCNTINLTNENINIDFDSDNLTLVGNDINCSVFITIKEKGNKTLKANFKNSNCNLFIWNECNEEVVLNETYDLYENSNVKISFADLYSNKLKRIANANAKAFGASCDMACTTLARGEMNIELFATNQVGQSSFNMVNSCVALKDSSYDLNAYGVIKKGAKEAKNFQENRSLTLGNVKKINVVPNLLIDENDVEAGHGCSIGDVDEEVLYYLSSRGLCKYDAMSLIVDSFLKSIADNLDDENQSNEIKDKIQKQVELYAK